jgi:hypothetical protein
MFKNVAGPPFHPCGFHGFQFIHGKCIKNIFINVHTHTNGGSSRSNNLSELLLVQLLLTIVNMVAYGIMGN